MLKICFLAYSLTITNALFSQGACVNADFSDGNFNGWTGKTGTFANPSANTGIVTGRHTIMSNPTAIDPRTCGGLPEVPPGSNFSAKLGNQSTGSQAEQLIYTLNVTPQNALFVYKYAVVLEDPGHTAAQQPAFNIRILDANGVQIGGNCGAYNVYAGQAGQNFVNCGSVRYLNWNTVGVDLSPYMGNTISIEFTTKDCSQSGHYGYAYIAAECMPMRINIAYCVGQNQVGLTAPSGFSGYTWYHSTNNPNTPVGSGQTITISNPVVGEEYNVEMNTFSNQGNCSVNLTAEIQPTIVTANLTHSIACVNDTIQFFDNSSVLNGNVSSWSWDFGDGTTSTQQNPIHTYTNNNTYNVTLISTSPAGCSDTITQQITPTNAPVPSFTALPNPVCVDAPIQFTNTSTDPLPMTYSWDFNDQANPGTDTQTNPSYTFSTPGQYYVMLTATNTNSCSAMIGQMIQVTPLPIVGAGVDFDICPGLPITLNGTGANTYTWSDNVTNNTQFIPNGTTTYTVTGTDINGCQNTDQITVTIHPSPNISGGNDVAVCLGENVTLSGTGAATYNWNNNINNGVSFTPSLGTLPYVLTATDANGCIGIDTVMVTVNPLPNVAFTASPTCINTPVTFTNQTVDPLPTNYSWTLGNNITSSLTSPIITYTDNGTYTITLTATNSNGCVNTTTQSITIHSLPNVGAGNDFMICPDLPMTLNGTGAVFYVWDNGVTNNTSFQSSVTTTYTVTGTDANGCQNTDQILVTVFPVPVISAGVDQSICPGDTVVLNGSGGVTYVWNNGVINNQEFVPAVTNDYIVAGTDENGCTRYDTVRVVVNPLPPVNAGVDFSLCLDVPITLTGSGAVSYEWSDNATNGVPFVLPLGTYTYTVTGTDANGCVNTDNITFNVVEWPIANFTPSDTVGSPLLGVYFENTSQFANNFHWDFQNTNTANVNDLSKQYSEYTQVGTYNVLLIASNGFCADSIIVPVVIIPWPDPTIVTPNIFTPDKNGANDLWHLNVTNASALKVQIFNRWGNLMAELDGVGTGWDGKSDGKDVSEGVYFYTYTLIDMNGKTHTGHGFLQLVKN